MQDDKPKRGRPARAVQEKPKTINMMRLEPMFSGGPTECDVHPDEVENMKKAGWREA